MPSIVNLFSFALPRTEALDCRNCSVPPTSTLLMTTPGMTRAIDHTSVRFGSDFEHVARDDRLLERRGRIEQRRFTADGHAFRERADFEPQVGARDLVGVHLDIALLGGPEALRARP